jgi:hypothetical protein
VEVEAAKAAPMALLFNEIVVNAWPRPTGRGRAS